MALGADGGRIRRLVLGQGLLVTSLGILAGVLLALASTRLLASLLFQVGSLAGIRLWSLFSRPWCCSWSLPCRLCRRACCSQGSFRGFAHDVGGLPFAPPCGGQRCRSSPPARGASAGAALDPVLPYLRDEFLLEYVSVLIPEGVKPSPYGICL